MSRNEWVVGGLSAIVLSWAAGAFAQGASSTLSTSAWRPVTIVEDGSAQAGDFGKLRKVPVLLPDDSKAKLAVDAQGQPQALLLSRSNVIADTRDRALEVGAALNGDKSLTLPVTTGAGTQIDFVIQPDGSAAVPAAQTLTR
jgi:hypothetical protein